MIVGQSLRRLGAFLYDNSPADATLAVVMLTLPGVPLVAARLPARHAARLDLAQRPAVGALVLAFGCICEGCAGKATPDKKGEGGSVPVVVTRVAQRDVPVDLRVVGNVEAYLTVTVKAQISGELTKVSFREGDYVRR